jgi:AcrR family transcriptional regulator
MAPSALYRYFDGRDALLSALILAAYEALADEAERAADEAERAADEAEHREGGDAASASERWSSVPRAIRLWALEHPHQWGLIFGTPVPGYQAPEDTVAPYARMAVALVRPLVAAHEAGRLRVDAQRRPDSAALRAAVAPVSEGLFSRLPAETAVLALQAWTTIVGAISLEVFGHWRNTVLDPGLFFETTIMDLTGAVGLH